MSYRHIYDPIAFLEYRDAVTWYAERSEAAALNLVKEIKQKIVVICKDPLRYRKTYKKFRETSLAIYPYSIIYLIDENAKTIIIASVYHHKQNPRRKFKK
ncbi:MAG: type II toxin-antitoxin system RelE/ParE family toxin [Chitinophagaceae bacterium]